MWRSGIRTHPGGGPAGYRVSCRFRPPDILRLAPCTAHVGTQPICRKPSGNLRTLLETDGYKAFREGACYMTGIPDSSASTDISRASLHAFSRLARRYAYRL